jgi:hypothetical protein
MSSEIKLDPITFSWSTEWLPRIRNCRHRMMATLKTTPPNPADCARVGGVWQQEIDDWLKGFDELKRRSVIDLLFAETDMLFETIDPSHGPRPDSGSSEFSDFRERWYDALPLAFAVERVWGFDRAAEVRRRFQDLEAYAERRGWLP